jgi:hypothetical protein
LPGDWDNLQLEEERKDWVDRMHLIDQTDKNPAIPETYDCTQFETDTYIKFRGFKKTDPRFADIPSIYDRIRNGRFNLPRYFLGIYYSNPLVDDHAAGAILVGSNPLNLDHWYIKEPQDDSVISPYELCDRNKSEATFSIEYIDYFTPSFTEPVNGMLIDFHVTPNGFELDGEPHKNLMLQRPTNPVLVKEKKPELFSLQQNRPNTFNPSTTIEYSLEHPGNVKLSIFNIKGQRLEKIVDGFSSSGKHVVQWNAKDNASGTYFYRLETEEGTETKRMMLVK